MEETRRDQGFVDEIECRAEAGSCRFSFCETNQPEYCPARHVAVDGVSSEDMITFTVSMPSGYIDAVSAGPQLTCRSSFYIPKSKQMVHM